MVPKCDVECLHQTNHLQCAAPKRKPDTNVSNHTGYDDDNTLEPKLPHPDNQWEEEAAEVLPWQSPCLLKYTDCVSPPPTGMLQAALNAFIGDLYMQELQQSIVENSNLTNIKEVANGVVHPITKETVTQYRTLISDPLP